LEEGPLAELRRDYGIDHSFEGRSADQRETLSDMRKGLILGLILIYLILAWVFSSYGWPVVVMAVIPFGLTGALFGHWVMGIDLTILSLFGMFGLSGIVVNDSIILVSFYKNLRADGMAVAEALVEAACQRLRAVLLTSLTTIAGLTPLLFEKSYQAQFLIPMATSIAFGLAFATVLVLLVIPSLLSMHESVDLQHLHRVLDHRQAVQVRMHHDIGDVAVHEDLPRRQADDLVGGYPAVGAADPQIARRLLLRETREKVRVVALDRLGPGAVVGEQVRQGLQLPTDAHRVDVWLPRFAALQVDQDGAAARLELPGQLVLGLGEPLFGSPAETRGEPAQQQPGHRQPVRPVVQLDRVDALQRPRQHGRRQALGEDAPPGLEPAPCQVEDHGAIVLRPARHRLYRACWIGPANAIVDDLVGHRRKGVEHRASERRWSRAEPPQRAR
jgi:hypothetical protein